MMIHENRSLLTDQFIICELFFQCSFARYMAGDGFDTWILEVRGAGLSRKGVDSFDRKPMNAKSKSTSSSVNYGKDGNVPLGLHSASNLGAMADSDILSAEEKRTYMESKPDQFRSPTKLMKNFMLISERLSSFLNEGSSNKFLLADMIRFL